MREKNGLIIIATARLWNLELGKNCGILVFKKGVLQDVKGFFSAKDKIIRYHRAL